jgi:hypothetical protein
MTAVSVMAPLSLPLLLLAVLLLPAVAHCWTPLGPSHNGGVRETLREPAAGVKPNILFLLVDVREANTRPPPPASQPACLPACLPVPALLLLPRRCVCHSRICPCRRRATATRRANPKRSGTQEADACVPSSPPAQTAPNRGAAALRCTDRVSACRVHPLQDFGWANAGWHDHDTKEVQTPSMVGKRHFWRHL